MLWQIIKLDEQQMLLATGRNRWIHHAANEVDRVLAAMPTVALSRDTLVVAVADEWGVPEATTLRELIDAAPAGAHPVEATAGRARGGQ